MNEGEENIDNQNTGSVKPQAESLSGGQASIENTSSPKPVDHPETQITSSNIPTSEITNMEVHKHPHHVTHKKKWGEYLLEFFMLFLAVFLGFVAENIREHSVEQTREKEYIISMIEDAKTDISNLQRSIASNTLRAKRLDTLAALCLNYDMTGDDDEKIHRLVSYSQQHPDFITATDRTIQQLKNAGGMRLIREKTAVDSIILYDDMSKKLADQQAYCELYQNKSIDISAELFNFKNLVFHNNDPMYHKLGDTSKKLINSDKTKLIELGNMIDMYQGVMDFYRIRLQEMNEHAVHLIQTLKKEYHLENE